MKTPADAISVVIPTLNEVDNLTLLFERIYNALTPSQIPFEIIVIDDNSTDNTLGMARVADAKFNVRAITKKGTPGKAFSLLEGFAEAQYDIICMIDGDLQYPPEAIGAMYHKMQYCKADVVITERRSHKTSPIRRLSSSVFNLMFTKLLFGIDYDTQSGLKLFKKKILKDMTLNPSPWSFDLEFIIRSLEQDYTVLSHEIEFSERHSGVPKVRLASATIEMIGASVRLRRNTATKRVRSTYKTSQLLQQSSIWFAALVISGFVFAQPAKTSALSLSDVLPSATHAVQSLLQPDTNNQAAATPTTTTTSQATTTATTQPTSTSNGSTSATTTAATSSAATQTTPVTSTSAAAASVPQAAPVATPTKSSSTLTTATGKQEKYYPASALSQSKTNDFTLLASSFVIAGALFLTIGLLSYGIKQLARKMNRQAART